MRPLSGRPGKPEGFRLMLILFVIRHLFGVALFAYLIRMAVADGGSFWMVMVGLCVAYTGFACYNGFKLLRMYRRSLPAVRRAAGSDGSGE